MNLHDHSSLLFAHQLGSVWSYLVILFFAFLDTVFIIGTIFPGSILIMVAGFLAAISSLNIFLCFIVVMIGVVSGDVLTYYIGTHGTNWFHSESKWLKFAYLKKGQKFFDKHGDKSILLGRFMGVIKAIVPFIAGLIRMDFKKFLYLNIISGVIWAVFYLGLGYFLGSSFHSFFIPREIKVLIIAAPFLLFFIWILYEYRNKIYKGFKNIFK